MQELIIGRQWKFILINIFFWSGFFSVVITVFAPSFGLCPSVFDGQGLRRSHTLLVGCVMLLTSIYYIRYWKIPFWRFWSELFSYLINHRTMPPIFFIMVFAVHLLSPVVMSSDSRWTIPTALSIIKEGNTDLDEYQHEPDFNNHYAIKLTRGHYYSIFPIGTSIIAVPFILSFILFDVPVLHEISWLSNYYIGLHRDMYQHQSALLSWYWFIEIVIASIIISCVAGIVYVIARQTLRQSHALLVAFIFAFCTSTWSTCSRALWSHTPSMLMLTITLYLLLLSKTHPQVLAFTSIPLSCAFIFRPTNSLLIMTISLWILIWQRKYFFRYLFYSLPVSVFFIIYNFSVYHKIISPYYQPQRIAVSSNFFEGLVGTLLSPSRGLFIFTPIFLLSLYGMYWKWKSSLFEIFDYILLCTLMLHWLVISSFPAWWGGGSYGPRLFSDTIPFFVYFLIPYIQYIAKSQGLRKYAIVSVFIIFLLISLWMHYRGATSWETAFAWNCVPNDIDLYHSRVWDWHDPQFLRGF